MLSTELKLGDGLKVDESEITPENAADAAELEFKAEQAALKGEKPEEKKPEEEAKPEDAAKPEEGAKSDEELLEAKEEDLSDDEKSRKVEVVAAQDKAAEDKKVEEDRLVDASDKDLSDEEKTSKAEVIKTREEAKVQADEEELTAYAKDNNVSLEDAKQEIEAIGKIQEKYGGDPKKMAKAMRELRQAQVKSDTDLKAYKEAAPIREAQAITVDAVVGWINKGELKDNKTGAPITKEQLLADYRASNPNLPMTADDDTVLVMVAKEIKSGHEAIAKESTVKNLSDAAAVRVKLVSELSEEDKVYLPTIQPLLEAMSPSQLLMPNFDIENSLRWARGDRKYIDIHKKEIEAAKQEGIKIGQENKKIKTGPVGKHGASATPKKGMAALSDAQKTEAWEMFPNAKSEEECAELYRGTLNDEAEIRAKNKKMKDEENKDKK